MENTFFIIKPDGVHRSLVGSVLSRIERRGFTIEKLEMRQVTKEILDQHYSDLVDRPFYPDIVTYMTTGTVVIGILRGSNVISSWRKMMGATDPADALPGTIRGDFAHSSDNGCVENIVHGSDCLESAEREIALWFGK